MKPKVDFFNTLFWRPERRVVIPALFALRQSTEHVDDTMNLARFWITRKSLEERSSAVQRPNVCHNAVLGRAHGMTGLL